MRTPTEDESFVRFLESRDEKISDVVVEEVTKDYRLGSTMVHALRGVSVRIERGELVALSGPSGSGKTTLLNTIGCIETPSSGRVLIEGVDIGELSDDELARLRARKIGFIFQNFNLLPVLTAIENVEYPLLAKRTLSAAAKSRLALKVLEAVGLARYKHHRPSELSGGQRQRVAIARAIVMNPRILLADEPTANLDQKTGVEILQLIKHINKSLRTTVIFSTHDPKVLEIADRIIPVADGHILERK